MEDAGFSVVLSEKELNHLSVLLGCAVGDLINESCDEDTEPEVQADMLERAAIFKRVEHKVDAVLDRIACGGIGGPA